MKLLVVTNMFHPDRGGGASVFSDMCYGLAERGHDVTVYAAYPYYPEWKNKSNANLWRTTDESIQGVSVRRFGMFIPSTPSKLIPRVLYELSFLLSLMRSLFYFRRFDAVMIYCPLLSAVAYGALRKLFYREPVWLNVQDIPADAAAASGISRGRFVKWAGQWVQGFLFNRADVWSTIAHKMVERISDLRQRNQPVIFLPNFLNRSMEEAIARHPSKVGRPAAEPTKFLYAGNIGKKQGLLEFCEELRKSSAKFCFRIHGNGGEAEAIRAWVESSGDSRFEFGEFLDEPGFVAALFETDLFVISEKPGVGASFIPSKLIPCIATGTPVLAVCDADGPLGQEINAHGLGATVDWSEIDLLWPRLEEIINSPENFSGYQLRALDRSQSYARIPIIETVEREFARLLPPGGVSAKAANQFSTSGSS
jgi:colanic acid biosynthesis glycosyl transferase WcaI